MSDAINGLFEFIGSILTWMNVTRTYKDKGYAGIYLPSVVFFSSWGIWNLYFYPHLNQWLSFLGGCSLVIANLLWVGMMYYYGHKKERLN